MQHEGAELHAAERAAGIFMRRVVGTPGSVQLSRDEARELAARFQRVVTIAIGYHLDAADGGTV